MVHVHVSYNLPMKLQRDAKMKEKENRALHLLGVYEQVIKYLSIFNK